MPLTEHRQDWEELAELDAMEAVLWRRGRQMDLDAFFATGEREVDRLLARLDKLGIGVRRRAAVDVGCGLGRVSRALAQRFDEVVGVDIAEGMVRRARELHADIPNLRFVRSSGDELACLDPQRFDLVYSRLVLQHLPAGEIGRHLREYVRLLDGSGAAVLQLPSRLAWYHRVRPSRTAYRLLRAAGVPPKTLYQRLRLDPARMTAVPVPQVVEWLNGAGAGGVHVETRRGRARALKSTFYATRS